MADKTGIQWTDNTFNPWSGYSEPRTWARKAAACGVRERVFCASMADYLEDLPVADVYRQRLLDLVRETAFALDWQLLTKRHDRLDLVPMDVRAFAWGMVSVENQEWADKRVPALLASDGWKIRAVSYDPALGPVDFSVYLRDHACDEWPIERAKGNLSCAAHPMPPLNWIVVGGESGPRARPFDVAWARSVIAQCKASGAACFVKQLGARPTTMLDSDMEEGRTGTTGRPDRSPWDLPLLDSHGADPDEWPSDLNVRQFPEVTP